MGSTTSIECRGWPTKDKRNEAKTQLNPKPRTREEMETTLHGSGENRQKPQRIRDEGSRHTFERRTDAASLISVPLWEMRP